MTFGRSSVVAALAALATVSAGCGAATSPTATPPRVLIVSGRDDHGLLAEPVVALSRRPGGPPSQDRVPDGTLVAVVEARHEWIRVRALEGAEAEGWVNDYYLRRTAHRACGNQRVELLAVSAGRVRVRPTSGGAPGWVPRDNVAELPGTVADPSRPCSAP